MPGRRDLNETESESGLERLEAEVTTFEKVLTLARECGFSDIAAKLSEDITEIFLRDVVILLCMADEDERARVAELHRRLRNCIG
jgi:hypothetical protein